MALEQTAGSRALSCRGSDRVEESVPNRCPTGMKTDVLGAIPGQAKVRVAAQLAHPCDLLGPTDHRS